jgi:hypothetical protein
VIFLLPTTKGIRQPSPEEEGLVVRFMVFNATFNNISNISWQSVLDQWASLGTLVSSINITDSHDATEIFLKIARSYCLLDLTLHKNCQ